MYQEIVNEQIERCPDDLRLWIRYLQFDCEALRRENKYLRKLLEEGKE